MSEVFTDFQIQKRAEWLRTQGPADSWFGHAAAIIEQQQAEIEQWRQHAAERVDTFERERSSLVDKLPSWLKAADVPPLGGQLVLTTFHDSEIYNTCIFYPGKGYESLETGHNLTGDVTHWMPLPEAPK